MKNQKQNAKDLIFNLRNNLQVQLSNVFKSDDNKYWAVSGWINNLYFHVLIREFNNKFTTEVSSNTDCVEDISILLMKYNLI
jgi:hypothetical protein